jgi:hypothetical protein
MRAWQAPAYGVLHARRWVATIVVLLVAALTGGLIAMATVATAAAGADAEAAASGAAHLGRAARPPGVPGGSLQRPATPEAPGWLVPLPAVPRGEPIRVLIPAIDVDADLVPLGLRSDRAMEVPDFGLAGWYAEGPRPGHPGPAVLAAHVDSRAGPDVFFRLRELAAGDRVHVLYDSGDRVTFVVTWSERTPKDALPVASMWPLTGDRLLALITCGGAFDSDARSYRDNIVVYTVPLDLEATRGTAGGASGLR